MSLSNLRFLVATVAWGLALFVTLSITQLPGNWGHPICGPWGCGPPLQALLGCHLSWLVLLVPIAELAQIWLSRPQTRAAGLFFISCGGLGVIGVLAYDLLTWWPAASELQRHYLLCRFGFVIATSVELPFIELFITGVFFLSSSFLKIQRT